MESLDGVSALLTTSLLQATSHDGEGGGGANQDDKGVPSSWCKHTLVHPKLCSPIWCDFKRWFNDDGGDDGGGDDGDDGDDGGDGDDGDGMDESVASQCPPSLPTLSAWSQVEASN